MNILKILFISIIVLSCGNGDYPQEYEFVNFELIQNSIITKTGNSFIEVDKASSLLDSELIDIVNNDIGVFVFKSIQVTSENEMLVKSNDDQLAILPYTLDGDKLFSNPNLFYETDRIVSFTSFLFVFSQSKGSTIIDISEEIENVEQYSENKFIELDLSEADTLGVCYTKAVFTRR